MAVHGPEVLAERLPKAIAAGLTPVVHAIGDAANRAVLDALEANLPALQAAGLRPRVEHVQHLHPDDLERLARLGAIASVQAYHLVFDAKRISELLGDRLGRAYPIRSLLAAGAHLAFGSDTPVADPDVRLGLRAATERRGEGGETLTPDEAIGVQEALAAYTRGAAFAIGREARSGQLKEGFDADLVVLSHNPLESLDGLEVLGTMLAGRWTRELEG
jgi:predicted amidohydrolase YtcJ